MARTGERERRRRRQRPLHQAGWKAGEESTGRRSVIEVDFESPAFNLELNQEEEKTDEGVSLYVSD